MGVRRRRPDLSGVVVLFGGRSEIGLEVVRRIARGRVVVLAARRPDDLAEQVHLVHEAGAAAVHTMHFDADDTDSHPALIASVVADHGPIGTAVVAFGILGDQARAERDVAHALQIAHTDYLAQISVLTPLATMMRAHDSGDIIVFSSVAGVRVRRANYVYGSTKAGLDGFASGLSDALHDTGVHLLLVRPGFVIGAMTKELMDSGVSPAPMSSTPDQVAEAVVRALHRRRRTVWIPWAIRPAFVVMRMLPQAIWRRMPR
ncbi:SDR family NAD(P)-dependent oxidoreductase [Williamsia sp. CHRR-6]|uniref:SDR family NAD(P)-dependent oxidoreductase n=1 Tax=Williamsia sp. CHRR-6 TaxID=2835871 RepID=UPI001BDB12DE|nr:SDR family NAD(P)-dependent oxidoreductase [Williamsia sp. CHRR-6]MBT0568126.1 SDR family NAD(P)-dependent oxidoreductase [Williamsia sp. CHRR-6]